MYCDRIKMGHIKCCLSLSSKNCVNLHTYVQIPLPPLLFFLLCFCFSGYLFLGQGGWGEGPGSLPVRINVFGTFGCLCPSLIAQVLFLPIEDVLVFIIHVGQRWFHRYVNLSVLISEHDTQRKVSVWHLKYRSYNHDIDITYLRKL